MPVSPHSSYGGPQGRRPADAPCPPCSQWLRVETVTVLFSSRIRFQMANRLLRASGADARDRGGARIACDTDAAAQQALRRMRSSRRGGTAVTQLLTRADVKALRLKPVEVEPTRSSTWRAAASTRRTSPDAARRMAILHTGPGLRPTTSSIPGRDAAVASAARALRRTPNALASHRTAAKHLAAQASAALARTEESAVGGRAPTG
jgi:hypothetical protein